MLPTAALLLSWAPLAHAQEVIEYYGTDHLGSVRVVFDSAGNVIARADYLPFGEEIFAPTGPMPAEQFTGQARDGEAGQDYFHARMYQPRTGRFNAVDPVYGGLFDPQQWNRYAYARNSPNSYVDPTGLFNVDTNCRQSQGAYWCPGSIFIPNRFDPSSVDQIFNAAQQGYQGGEALGMAEMGWAGAMEQQFQQRYEQSQRPKGETDARMMSPSETATSQTTCTGPGPGCKAVSLHPGQEPIYVPDHEFQQVQKLQAALVAAVLWKHPVRVDLIRVGTIVVPNQLVVGPGTAGATLAWGVSGGGRGLPFHYHIHRYNVFNPMLWPKITPMIKPPK